MTSPCKDKHFINTPNVRGGAIGKGKEKHGRQNYGASNNSLENSFTFEISTNRNDATSSREGMNLQYILILLWCYLFFFFYV